MFQLASDEKSEVVANCDHLAKLKFAKPLPLEFTEYVAIQAANVLNSAQEVEMGIYVVRAFVRMRELVAAHHDLAKRLEDLEEKTGALALQQFSFAHNTRVQLKQVAASCSALADADAATSPVADRSDTPPCACLSSLPLAVTHEPASTRNARQ